RWSGPTHIDEVAPPGHRRESPARAQATGGPIMTRSHRRWSSLALAAAMFAGATLGFLSWRRSHALAREHAARAQRALDEMGRHYANIKLCTESLRTARRPADRAGIEAIMRSSRTRLVKLEEAAARHERLARDYGYRAALNRPDPDPKP